MNKKTALVTGATSGIGEQYAIRLAQEGYNMILAARSAATLEALAEKLNRMYGVETHTFPIDLSVEHAAAELAEGIQKRGLTVDYLVNNAGFGFVGSFTASDYSSNHQQMMLNIMATAELTHLMLRQMVERNSGTIVNVASKIAFYPVPYMAIYAATKAFVLSFTEALWEEYRNQNIRIMALCPGPTETRFFTRAGEVSAGKMRSATQVVDSAFHALAKGKPFVIDGKQNWLESSLLPRLLPRKAGVKLIGSIMRKQLKGD